jgi:hypothetical protein
VLDAHAALCGDGRVRIAALVTWLLAALAGGFLLRTWLVNGGLRTREGYRTSRFSPVLILGHAGLAATGLGVWIAYLVADVWALSWTAVGLLVVVAALGATMFGLWLRSGRGRTKGRHEYMPRHAAEDHFPPPAVLTHGLFAVATVVLAVLTAV